METKLRKIREDDLEVIMNWRTNPDITKYMNTDPILTLESQRAWFQSILQNEKVRYWMIEEKGKAAGIINLADIDWIKGSSSWGYYIGEKSLRSLKLALSLEMSLYDYVFKVLGFHELHSEVFSLNEGVIKLHLACGSRIERIVQSEVRKNGVLYDIAHMRITSDEWGKLKSSKKYALIDFDSIF